MRFDEQKSLSTSITSLQLRYGELSLFFSLTFIRIIENAINVEKTKSLDYLFPHKSHSTVELIINFNRFEV